MKILAPLLMLIAVAVHVQASAGPPPFTNGSPLVSGVDGSYQATARGTNLTGVFRFTYSNGRQTSNPQLPTGDTVSFLLTDPYNDYVFFVEGLVYRGLVQANINVGSVAGVFDNGSANVYVFGDTTTDTDTDGNTSTITTSGNILSFMNGFFNGSMDQNSPYACFSGTGEVTVNQQVEVVVGEEFVLIPGTGTSDDNPAQFNVVPVTAEVITPVSVVEFEFSGVRNATGTSTSTSTTTTTSTTSG